MAAERKKGTSQGRKQTAKKGSSSGRKSSGRNDRKDSNGTDILTIVVVVLAVVLVVFLLINYNKEKGNGGNENEDGKLTATPIGTPSATVTDVPGDITPTAPPEKQPTGTPPAGTTPATRPTAGAQNTPKPTEPPVLSVEEAENIVRNRIGNPEYTVELLDDHLMIDGEEYYSFCVNDKNGETMEPLLIVEKKEGQLFCYDFSGVVSQFSKFPLDKTETGSSGTDVISEEQAEKVLLGYSGKALGLAMEVSEYEMEVDKWKTIVDGKECYGINLYATVGGVQSRCTYYVAPDGSAVYSINDVTGEVTKW